MKILPNDPKDIETMKRELKINLTNGNVIGYHLDKGTGLFALVNYYKDLDIELHVFGSGFWATKEVFRHLFTHIFHEDLLNCKRCSAKIWSKNHKCIKLVERLGFVKEGELRGLDTNLYSLLKEDCTWVA